MAERILKVTVLSDFRKYQRDQKEMEGGFTRFERRVKGVSTGLQGFGALLVSGSVALGLKKTIDAASDMAESASKLRVVFGPATAQVEKFAETAATSLGMSRREAIEATASLGNLFVSMKLGQKPAADMSTRMVQLASDLASFNNSSPEEALEALRAGLVGETEPLRRFGINLSDAALRAEVMRLGLGKVGSTLTAAQKAQASYSLILAQSTTAQGDFARTADGAANSQRIANARFEDAKVKLGNQLLPVYTDALKRVSDLVDAFTKLDESTGGATSKLLLGGAAVAGLGFVAAKVVGQLLSTRNAWNAYKAAKLAQVPVNAAVAASEEALAAKTLASGAAAQTAGGMWTGLLGILGRIAAIGTGVGAAATLLAGDTDQTRFRKQADGLSEAERRWHELVITRGTYNRLVESDKRRFQELDTQIRDHARSVQELQAQQKYAAMATRDLGTAADAAAPATVKLGDAHAAAKAKIKAYRDAVKEATEKVAGMIPVLEGYTAAKDVNAASIVKSLRQERDAYSTWATDVQRLLRRGADPKFVQELSQKGPAFVHAMAVGSDRELGLAEKFFKQRTQGMRKVALAELRLTGAGFRNLEDEAKKAVLGIRGKTVEITATASMRASGQILRDFLAGGVRRNAEGGLFRGQGTGTSDSNLSWISDGEFIVKSSATRQHRALLEAINEDRLAAYQTGGLAGAPIGLHVRGKFDARDLETGAIRFQRAIDIVGRALGRVLGGLIGPMIPHTPGSWRLATSYLASLGIPYDIISTFRPGARTRASGSVSYHALNRAVDLAGPNMLRIFDALAGTNPTELIYSAASRYKSRSGWHPIGRLDPITRADHWSHVHAAYRSGTPFVPETGLYELHRGERVVPAEQNRAATAEIHVHAHFHGPVLGSAKQAARELAPEIRSQIRSALRREGKLSPI